MDSPQSIRDHMLELRRRVTFAAVSVLVTTVVAFVFYEQILQLLLGPAEGFVDMPNGKPIYTDLTEFIGIAAKTSLMVGIFASLPFVLYQAVMFIAPGLNKAERRYLYALLPATLITFMIGASFGYRVLFPPMVKFLLTFGNDVATPMIRIGTFVNLMLRLLFWMGIIFETPVVIFFLAKIGLVTPSFLARNRRWALVIAFVLGALITPTIDPINQAIIAGPTYALYEISIWLAKFAARGRRKPSLNMESQK